MSSTTESQIKYAGDGVQVLFTFPFTYLQSTDIYVSLYNETERRWDDTTEWTFANATTIQFTTAPPTATGAVTDNIRIQRRTSIDPLVAQFNPGSAIRASDLNNDFEQLQLAIIDNSTMVTNVDVGVTSIIAGEGISVDQATGNVTITNTQAEDLVTSVNGQTGDVSLDIDDLTDVDTSSPGHVPTNGQALVWNTSMSHWMPGTVEGGGGIPEAPEDNKVYGRENAEWVVVADGETGPVLSVNGQTGSVSVGVEQLADFAYYPSSNEGTLEGPLVDGTLSPTLSGSQYYCEGPTTGPSSTIFFSKDNTQLYDILNTLEVGEALNVFYYTSYVGYGWEVRKDTTFMALGVQGSNTDNWAFVMSGGWTGIDVNGFSAVPGQPTGGLIRFESAFITNGSVPLESGQALIYDKTTESWRPEDIATELNISALPTLP